MKSEFPRIPILQGWDDARRLLDEEIKQSLEEGREPAEVEKFRQRIEAAASPEECANLWYEMQEIPQRADFAFVEPSDLKAIQADRTDAPRQLALSYGADTLYDRMYGAWLGRSAGCALGKPVECFMGSHEGLSSKERIKTYLTAVSPDEYPIKDYFPIDSPGHVKTGRVGCPASTREKIAFMETDDDIRYTVIGQVVTRNNGSGFTTSDVAVAWMDLLGYRQVCTAETQAYRNIVLRFRHRLGHHKDDEIDWHWVATHQNPYREWIGAQIRADSWGYAAAGNPELAADFAWRDARLSHVKNGIYGEMFCAEMIAAGFSTPDPLKVVEAGLAEIPRRSRLHKDILDTIVICQEHGCRASEFETVLEKIYQLLGHYHPVHTNNNAALVVAALLLGNDDFEKTIGIAVMGGWDSDCNGATAGSIWGAMFGASKMPKKWIGPLNDTLYSYVVGYHPIAISECAKRSVEIAQGIAGQH